MKSESDEILELEEALRGDLPDERDAARLRARLAGLGLGLGVTLTSATAAALAGSKSTAPAGIWGFLSSLPVGAKVGIATVVAASAVGGPAYYSASDAPVTTVPAARVAPRAPAPAPAAPRPALEADATELPPAPLAPAVERVDTEPPRAVQAEPALRSPSAAEPRATTPLPPAAAATLSEETRLLDAALAALRRGERAAAVELIREHERRFPDGLLRRERERARAALIEHSENRP